MLEHLNSLQNDMLDNIELFTSSPDEQERSLMQLLTAAGMDGEIGKPSAMRRYGVNILVDNSKTAGAPIVYEDVPTSIPTCSGESNTWRRSGH